MTLREASQLRVRLSSAYEDYNRMLKAHAFLKVQNKEIGEDLVQKTFVKMWLYLIKDGKVYQMKAFLFHILRNLIIDEYRKPKISSLDYMLEKGFEPSTDKSESIMNTIDSQAVIILIQHLPLKYKSVMNMRYNQDMSVKEISTVNHQLENTNSVILRRGLQKLKLLYNSPRK